MEQLVCSTKKRPTALTDNLENDVTCVFSRQSPYHGTMEGRSWHVGGALKRGCALCEKSRPAPACIACASAHAYLPAVAASVRMRRLRSANAIMLQRCAHVFYWQAAFACALCNGAAEQLLTAVSDASWPNAVELEQARARFCCMHPHYNGRTHPPLRRGSFADSTLGDRGGIPISNETERTKRVGLRPTLSGPEWASGPPLRDRGKRGKGSQWTRPKRGKRGNESVYGAGLCICI